MHIIVEVRNSPVRCDQKTRHLEHLAAQGDLASQKKLSEVAGWRVLYKRSVSEDQYSRLLPEEKTHFEYWGRYYYEFRDLNYLHDVIYPAIEKNYNNRIDSLPVDLSPSSQILMRSVYNKPQKFAQKFFSSIILTEYREARAIFWK